MGVDEWEVEAAHNPNRLLGVSIGGCCEKVMGTADGESESADKRTSLADTLNTLAIESSILLLPPKMKKRSFSCIARKEPQFGIVCNGALFGKSNSTRWNAGV